MIPDNKDFPLIQRHYDFIWIGGNEYFND